MALSARVGSFSSGTGIVGSTVVVNDVGFTPKALLFWWSGRTETVDTAGGASHRRGIGAAAGTSSRWALTNQSWDGQATSASDRAQREDACVATLTTAGAIDGLLDLQSFDSGTGFTLVVDDPFATDLRVHYLALGGDDLQSATTVRFQEPNAVGNQSITTVGFQGDFLLLAEISHATTPPAVGTTSAVSIGAAVSPTQQGILSVVSADNNAAMNTDRYCNDAECIGNIDAAAGVLSRASFGAWLSNGFQLNWLESNGTRQIFALVLRGGRYAVRSGTTQTDTSTPITLGALGVGVPVAALFLSHCTSESTQDVTQVHDSWSVGAATSAAERVACAVWDENGTGTSQSEVATAVEYDAVYVNIGAGDVVQGLMDVTSFGDSSVNLIMDDADPSGSFFWVVAFGSAAAPGVRRVAVRRP